MSLLIPDRLMKAVERLAVAAEETVFILLRVSEQLGGGAATLHRIDESLESLEGTLDEIRFCLGRPGQPNVVFTEEEKENDVKKILFKVMFAPELDPTTVSRELSVQIGEDLPVVQTVGLDVPAIEGYKAPEDTPIHIEQVDIDDKGNRSTPAVVDAVVADTFPPQQPGLPGVMATGEVNEE